MTKPIRSSRSRTVPVRLRGQSHNIGISQANRSRETRSHSSSGSLSRAQLRDEAHRAELCSVFAGSVAGSLGGQAKADVISDADLAYARYSWPRSCSRRISTARRLRPAVRRGAAQVPEAGAVQRAGALQLGRADPERRRSGARRRNRIDFAYPKGSFASQASIAALGVTLETVFLGAYLGAVGAVQAVRWCSRWPGLQPARPST